MHEIFNTIQIVCMLSQASIKGQNRWRAPQQSKFSHGKLQSTKNRLSSWLLWAVTVCHHDYPKKLKQKYLQHSYRVSFLFLASYSHCNSFLTAATCVIVNSMAITLPPYPSDGHTCHRLLLSGIFHGDVLNQRKFLFAKYLYVTFSHSTMKWLRCKIIYACSNSMSDWHW